MQRERVTTAALITADVVTLLLLRPSARLAADLGHPRAWIARVGLDTALASLAATAVWVVAAWVALGLVAAAVRRTPGAGGRLAGRISDVVLPGVLRRVIAGSAGVGVLLAPLPATATAADRSPVAGARVASGDLAVPAPLWPSAEPSSTTSGGSSPSPAPLHDPRRVPAPRWPSAPRGAPATSADQTPPGGTGGRPALDPTTPTTRAARRHAPTRHDGSATVRNGDCLWLIAARRLGPDATAAAIANSWPRWYAANRSVVGDDPNLIHPGVVLQAPAAHHPEARS